METIGPVVDEVIDIAREHLKQPISVKIWTWEDGTFKVHAKHWYPAGVTTRYGHRSVIQYHSDREVVKGYLLEKDTETDDESLLLEAKLDEINDPVPRKNERG
jgi:hypothetical protein